MFNFKISSSDRFSLQTFRLSNFMTRRRPLIHRSKSITSTSSSSSNAPISSIKKSHRDTQKLISSIHTLRKRLHQIPADAPSPQDCRLRANILAEIERLGGLDAYQKASLLGQSPQRGGDSSKWLLKHLTRPSSSSSSSDSSLESSDACLRLLDVGALRNNYSNVKWIKPTCIDLNSQHPDVHACDYMDFEISSQQPAEKFDVLCLSLVLNFVELPPKRGAMLRRVRRHLKDEGGKLFIVLPLACIENSRYMTHEHFLAILNALGYVVQEWHYSKKLAYYVFVSEKVDERDVARAKLGKRVLKEGPNRNNFAITLTSYE